VPYAPHSLRWPPPADSGVSRGSITFKTLFDTLGDHRPGGVELGFEMVKVVGMFPGLDVDLCDLAVDLVG